MTTNFSRITSCVSAQHSPKRERYEAGSKHEEDPRLDALKCPEPIGRLKCERIRVSMRGQATDDSALVDGCSSSTSGRDFGGTQSSSQGYVTTRSYEALRNKPRSRRRIASGSGDGCGLDQRCQVVRAQVDADSGSKENKSAKRRSDRRQYSTEERAHRNTEGDGKQRIGDRCDSLLVKSVESRT